MQDLKAKLKAVLNIRLIAWFCGLALIIGSIIYFTGGPGGGYKGLVGESAYKTGTDLHSCSEWGDILNNLWETFISSTTIQDAETNLSKAKEEIALYSPGPTCVPTEINLYYFDTDYDKYLEQAKKTCEDFTNNLNGALTEENLDQYNETYETKAKVLKQVQEASLKDFCLDDSQKQTYSAKKADLESKITAETPPEPKFTPESTMQALKGLTTPIAASQAPAETLKEVLSGPPCEEWKKIFEDSFTSFINSSNLQEAETAYSAYKDQISLYGDAKTCSSEEISAYIQKEQAALIYLEDAQDACKSFSADAKGELLGKTVSLKDFCSATIAEPSADVGALLIAKDIVSPIKEIPTAPEILVSPLIPDSCKEYKNNLKANYDIVFDSTVYSDAVDEAKNKFVEIYGKNPECDFENDNEIQQWLSYLGEKQKWALNCWDIQSILEDLHTQILAFTAPDATFDAKVKDFMSGYESLGTNKCMFDEETNKQIVQWQLDVNAKIKKPEIQLSPECQTKKTDLEKKYKTVQSASLETLKPAATDFVLAYNSYIEACSSDKSNVKAWYADVEKILKEKLVAPCTDTLKTITNAYEELKLEEYLTKQVVDLFKSQWDSFIKQCPDLKTPQLDQAYAAMLSMLEAKIKKEPTIITEIKCPTNTASILTNYKSNYDQAKTDAKKIEWGYKFTSLVDQTIAQGCSVSEDFKIAAAAVKKETDALLAEMTAALSLQAKTPLLVYEQLKKTETKLQEKVVQKLGHKLPAWGAEEEWETEAGIIEETPKTVQIEKPQPEQKSYSAQSAPAPAVSAPLPAPKKQVAKQTTKKKTQRPSAAKRVKETTSTGPETLIYLLVAAASYGASIIARKRK